MRVEQVVPLRDRLLAGVRVERDDGLARRPPLRSDDDDAARAARAVDRGRRGVLEDLDRGDVGRIDRGERILRHRRRGIPTAVGRARVVRIVLDREAVDDVEWLVVAADRRAPADADREAAARRARRLGDLHAGRGALQRLLDRGDRRALDLRRDGRNRPGEIGTTLRAVADDYDLLERDGRLREAKCGRDRLPGGDGDRVLSRPVADELRTEAVPAGCEVGDGEAPIGVRPGAPHLPDAADRHAAEWHAAVGVEHGAGHSARRSRHDGLRASNG